jgi:hypothetical protein
MRRYGKQKPRANKQIRVYCLSDNDQLQEYAYSSRNPKLGWTAGSLHSENTIYAYRGSAIAAICWEAPGSGEIQIRLYYQGNVSCAFVLREQNHPPRVSSKNCGAINNGAEDTPFRMHHLRRLFLQSPGNSTVSFISESFIKISTTYFESPFSKMMFGSGRMVNVPNVPSNI